MSSEGVHVDSMLRRVRRSDDRCRCQYRSRSLYPSRDARSNSDFVRRW